MAMRHRGGRERRPCLERGDLRSPHSNTHIHSSPKKAVRARARKRRALPSSHRAASEARGDGGCGRGVSFLHRRLRAPHRGANTLGKRPATPPPPEAANRAAPGRLPPPPPGLAEVRRRTHSWRGRPGSTSSSGAPRSSPHRTTSHPIHAPAHGRKRKGRRGEKGVFPTRTNRAGSACCPTLNPASGCHTHPSPGRSNSLSPNRPRRPALVLGAWSDPGRSPLPASWKTLHHGVEWGQRRRGGRGPIPAAPGPRG